MPTLTRREGVELARTGRWKLGTGEWSATAHDFAAAIAATSCPGIRRPYIRIGHTDGRFGRDGDPALGWLENLRVSDDGHTLLGDYTGVPEWLDDVLATAYPDRSVEGAYNRTCQLGHRHPFVLDGVALLGVTRPGVGTLESLADVRELFQPPGGDPDEVPIAATIPGATWGPPPAVKAAAVEHTGAMIALVPSPEDAERLAVDGGEPADELHVTLAYLGEAADIPAGARAELVGAVTAAMNGLPPVEAEGFAVSAFNPNSPDRDPCIVLGLGGLPLAEAYTRAQRGIGEAATGVEFPDQRKPWIPHLTFAYTDDLSKVAEWADRTGPARFDRVRLAFAGEHTDIPLTAAPVAASEGTPMPNPVPSRADLVREAWNARAPFSQYVHQVRAADVIVLDEDTRTFLRVPVTITGEQVEFGEPVKVMNDFVPLDELVAASAVTYATRAESRPVEQTPTEPAQPQVEPVEPAPEPEPAEPVQPAPTIPPAAEPDPNTDPKGAGPVSTLSTDVRSRLGLAEDADDVAVLAALDALKVPAKPADPDPETVAASAAAEKENLELRAEVKLLAEQVQKVSAELAETKAAKAETVKASVLDDAQRQGKFTPADREKWLKDYDDAPTVVTRILASIAPGTAVPVAASGYTGEGDVTASANPYGDISDADMARFFENTAAAKTEA